MSQLYQRKPYTQNGSNSGDNSSNVDSNQLKDNKTAAYLNSDNRQSISLLGKKHWIAGLLFGICVYYCVYTIDSFLPEPLTPDQAGSNMFSEIRARRHLEEMSAYGPKPSGSYAAEVLTRNYILKQLEEIQKNLNSKRHVLDISVQKPNGCFDFSFLSGFMLCYKNVTNIVAILSPNHVTDFSVLVNCHFDSVPSSPGATDDLSSCSIMLEMLNVMSRSEKSFSHNVIFLFNGAEENFMQGAHGFITQHRLRHTIKAFINLEGAGAGGREFLFQSGPSNMWMLHAYLDSATRPHGSVMAQEVFESGIILSDTDYRVFRDYGRLSGLDIAYVKNGYLYHTEFDNAENIPPGSLQRSGDNVLATLITMAQSPCLAKPCPDLEEKLVFFDVLGFFIIQYPLAYSTILNYLICVLVLVKILNQFRSAKSFSSLNAKGEKVDGREFSQISFSVGYTVGNFLSQLFLHFLSLISMIGCLFVTIRTVQFLDLTLCWYSQPILILPLYIMPPILAGFFVHLYIPKRINFLNIKDLYRREQVTFDVSLSLIAIVLFVLTYLGLRSAYFVLVLTGFPLLRDILRSWVQRFFGACQRNANVLYVCHVIALTPVSILGAYALVEVFTFFIPMMGRSCSKVNPEIFVAGISGSTALMVVFFHVSLSHISRGVGYLMKCCLALIIFVTFVISVTSLGSPYTFDNDSPRWRRLHLQHVRRRILMESGENNIVENGVWIASMDFRGVQDLPVDMFLQGSKVPYCLQDDEFCGLPYYLPLSDVVPPRTTLWLAVPETPDFTKPISVDFRKEEISPAVLNYTFFVNGPDHVTLSITPKNLWKIDSWTFTIHPIDIQQTYFIYLANVNTEEPWTFSLQLSNDNQTVDNTKSKLLIAASSHQLHGERQFSKTLRTMVKTVKERRVEPELTKGHWKWAMTVEGWCSDYLAQYFY